VEGSGLIWCIIRNGRNQAILHGNHRARDCVCFERGIWESGVTYVDRGRVCVLLLHFVKKLSIDNSQ